MLIPRLNKELLLTFTRKYCIFIRSLDNGCYMHIFKNLRNKLYEWYGKKTVLAVFVVIATLVFMVVLLGGTEENVDVAENGVEKPVRIESVYLLLSGDTLSTIGTVEAINESRIESEASGRITGVYVDLGEEVRAGTIVAELENASERAAVLQAEGAYEAALASAAKSDVSVEGAETALASAINGAINVYRSVLTTADDTVRNLVDDFYSDIDAPPFGIKVSAEGQANRLINERLTIESILDAWSANLNTSLPSDAASITTLLHAAREDTKLIADHVDEVSFYVSKADANATFSANELAAYDARFLSARSSLNSALDAINNNLLTLKNAEDALTQARLSGTNPDVSAANAQVKQALGSLRAAQANLSKTIVRTSIGGTVNELPVRKGDFVGMRDHIATVANNGALLITTYISEADRNRLSIGDEVIIDGSETGIITRIAPVVESITKKIEVKIETQSEKLANGDIVRVALSANDTTVDENLVIRIPISALKVETDRTVVFTKNDADVLIAHEVVTGPLVGENIIIEEGVTPEMEIVLDARGLNEGDKVTVVE